MTTYHPEMTTWYPNDAYILLMKRGIRLEFSDYVILIIYQNSFNLITHGTQDVNHGLRCQSHGLYAMLASSLSLTCAGYEGTVAPL